MIRIYHKNDWLKNYNDRLISYNEYVDRKIKLKNNVSNELFYCLCRISYIIGEPLELWIDKFK